MKGVALFICIATGLSIVACSKPSQQTTEIKRYSLDSLDGLITESGAQLDKENSGDGKGSLRITATEPTVVRLFETGDINVENARLFYAAKVRTKGLKGRVYLEMLCDVPGKGEFFSRNDRTAVTGSTKWINMETVFFIKRGEKPDNVKLNLVIDGKGTVWIDDVRLLKGAL
ncbi:MAG TPA: hypothetical protein DCP92_00390 [Nitrospiraceae bacterium]|nr:hypothetical protein [Nitrospiraceae bacterium]